MAQLQDEYTEGDALESQDSGLESDFRSDADSDMDSDGRSESVVTPSTVRLSSGHQK